ncbi:MAG: hypothetical protein QOD83_1395 [Solirubrobacteraceae bacterium]|nr:hypothetical protein [Solirubrobacteraceae bacterium]
MGGFLGAHIAEDDLDDLFNASTSAALLVEADERLFALTFGHGRHLLEPEAIEQDFGLKVVLNTVEPTQLKSVDARTIDELTVHTRRDVSRDSSFSAFGLDPTRDLLRAPNAKLVHAGVKSGVSRDRYRKLSLKELRVLQPPSGRWEYVDDHPDEPMLGAARYDVNSHELIINADWRNYVELRDCAVAHVDQATTPAEKVWTIVAEQRSRGLSEIVMHRRHQAFQDGLLDRIGGYLSEDALTTAVTSGSAMKSLVAQAVRKRTEPGRRRQRKNLARLAAAE